MAIPGSADARRFYRSAFRRFEEANVLLAAGFSMGAVYLAGYAVECILKSLILEAAHAPDRAGILESFRGGKAHDFGWLRT